MIALLYDWLLSFHILMAVTWVGGAIALQILGTRIARAGDRGQLYAMAGHFGFVGSRIFAPASVILLGLGVWMVAIGPWDFTMLWVDLALVMFAFSFVSGTFYLSPQLERVRHTAEREGPDSEQVATLIQRVFLVSRAELVLLLLIVLDMVLKPFL